METKTVLIGAYLLVGLIWNSTAYYVNLTEGGYQNVVVNIAESVVAHQDLNCHNVLGLVQDAVREMSDSFGRGMDNEALTFGAVTIVIPETWSENQECNDLINNTVPIPSWVRTYKADIDIISDHPVFGAQPYSFQYGGCGQPGLPINLPITVLTNEDATARGKRLAKEWAHYRYGVFDEGGVPYDIRHPSGYSIYQTDGSVVAEPNICSNSRNLNGHLNNDSCPDVATTGCELELDREGNSEIYSSLMYRPDLSKMDKFCTKETHNRAAPSKHNYFCHGLSAAEVINQHDDFKNTMLSRNRLKEVSFNVIRNPFLGYHIIIDTVSFDNDAFQNVKNSISSFISLLPTGLYVSVNSFDSQEVTEVQKFTRIDGTNSRDEVLKSIRDNISCNTGEGSYGFIKALNRAQLNADRDVIIVTALRSATDNEQQFESVLQQLLDNKVNIHLLCYQNQLITSVVLAQLTRYGSFHLIPQLNSDPWATSSVWAVNTLQSIYSMTHVHRAKIFEKTVSTNISSHVNGRFYLDSDVSKIIVCIYKLQPDSTKLHLLGGSIWFKETNLTLNMDQVGQFLTFELMQEQGSISKGLWQYEIIPSKSNTAVKWRLDIWVENDDNLASDFIKLRTWNSASYNQVLDWTRNPIGIYAELTQNRKPVTGANVVATVYVADDYGNSIRSQEIFLKDDGLADVTSGDGIYSAWISNVSTTSFTYSIQYMAYGVNGLAQVDSGKYERAPTTPGSIPIGAPVSAATQFNRLGYGPSFMVNHRAIHNVDNLPPQRITDLTLEDYDAATKEIILTWSCPLDNFGFGKPVTHFVVSQSIGYGDAEAVTDAATQFDITDGRVRFSINLPDQLGYGEYVHFVVQGQDADRNTGDKSNIVSLYAPPSSGLSVTAWVFIGLAILLLVIVLILLVLCWLRPDTAKRIQHHMTPSKRKKESETIEVAEWVDDRRVEHTTEERHYFGQEDIDSIKSSFNDESWKGTEEVVTSVPSIDLQLSNVIKSNNDALSLYDEFRPENMVESNPAYAAPFKRGTTSVESTGDHQLSKPSSAANIFYTDIPIHSRSSNSTTEGYTIQNEYASPVYADPRLNEPLQLQNSTFDPKIHPANQSGLPPIEPMGKRRPRQRAPRLVTQV